MGGGWSTPRPDRFTPGKDPVPIVQEVGWAPVGRSGRVRKISPPTGIRSPHSTVRSESLYRLSYPGPKKTKTNSEIHTYIHDFYKAAQDLQIPTTPSTLSWLYCTCLFYFILLYSILFSLFFIFNVFINFGM